VASTPACYGSSLGLNPDISQKFKMGDISKEVAKTLWPAKKYTKSWQISIRFICAVKRTVFFLYGDADSKQ
jgi:hypothetical protein